MKTLLTFFHWSVALLATAQPTTALKSQTVNHHPGTTQHTRFLPGLSDTVRFECATCQGNMKLMVIGKGTDMTYEQKTTHPNNTLFPVAIPLAPGNYEYVYWQNGVQQIHLLFKVKSGEKNVVTVK